MREALIISSMVGSITLVTSLVFGVRGIYSLISGRCSLKGNKVRGKQARLAGLVLACQFIAGMAVYAVLFETFRWGSSGSNLAETARKGIASGISQAMIFSAAIVAGYLIALSIAKRRDENSIGTDEEEAPDS